MNALEAHLRQLALSLNVARDWDVFCLETLLPLPQQLDIVNANAALAALAQTRRLQGDRFAQDLVAHPRFTQVVVSMALALYFRSWGDEAGQ